MGMDPLGREEIKCKYFFLLRDLVAFLEVGSATGRQTFHVPREQLPPFAPVHESSSLIHCFYNKGLFYNEKSTVLQPQDDVYYRNPRIRK